MQNEFQLTMFQLGVIPSVFAFSCFIGTVVWSRVLETPNYKKYISLGTVAWLIILIILGFSRVSFVTILILSSILGFFIESTNIFVYRIVIIEPDCTQAGKRYSTITMVQGAGGIFGALLTAQIQDLLNLPWRVIFIVIFFVFIVLLVIMAVKLNRISNFLLFCKEDTISWKSLLSIEENRLVFFIMLISFLGIYSIHVWMQKYMQLYHGMTQAASVLTLVLFGIAQSFAFIIGGFIVDRLKVKNPSQFSKIGFFSIFITMPFLFIGFSLDWRFQLEDYSISDYFFLSMIMIRQGISDFAILIGLLFISIGYFYNIFVPFLYSVLKWRNTDENAYKMINLIFILHNFMFFFVPPVSGLIADLVGIENLMFFSVILMLTSLFPHFRLKNLLIKNQYLPT